MIKKKIAIKANILNSESTTVLLLKKNLSKINNKSYNENGRTYLLKKKFQIMKNEDKIKNNIF